MPSLSFPQVTQPTSLEWVHFRDGMIVHADDLDSAVRYPVDMFRMLVRAFFGCGLVCGLDVEQRQSNPPSAATAFVVVVKPGVAVDCAGYPIELCREVVIDLMPGPSSCRKPECVCILIRRLAGEASAPRPCGCGEAPSPEESCGGGKTREQVQIKVFDCKALPSCLCRHEKPQVAAPGEGTDEWRRICECLHACGSCGCGGSGGCGEDGGWVLLACVEFALSADNQPTGIGNIDRRHRRYVKPIDCLCHRDAPDDPVNTCPPAGDGGNRPTDTPADPLVSKRMQTTQRQQPAATRSS